MTKQEYRAYCQNTPDLPVFLKDWWMDAVCTGKRWELIADMPCLIRERAGLRYIVMPQQTQIGGYWSSNQGLEVEKVAKSIAEALKQQHLGYYYQHFPLGSPIPEKLAKLGFTIRKHTTYRIEDTSNPEAIEHRFSENKRRQIRKAANLQLVSLEPQQFYAFHKDCLTKQGKQIAYSETFFHALNAACAAHNARQILALQDSAGELHAAVYLVFDKQTCYFLIPCYAPQHGSSGAGARIVAEAVRFASGHGLAFDFEGSMIPGVANHYAQFGSTPAYFYEVERIYNPLFRLLLTVYQLITRKKR